MDEKDAIDSTAKATSEIFREAVRTPEGITAFALLVVAVVGIALSWGEGIYFKMPVFLVCASFGVFTVQAVRKSGRRLSASSAKRVQTESTNQPHPPSAIATPAEQRKQAPSQKGETSSPKRAQRILSTGSWMLTLVLLVMTGLGVRQQPEGDPVNDLRTPPEVSLPPDSSIPDSSTPQIARPEETLMITPTPVPSITPTPSPTPTPSLASPPDPRPTDASTRIVPDRRPEGRAHRYSVYVREFTESAGANAGTESYFPPPAPPEINVRALSPFRVEDELTIGIFAVTDVENRTSRYSMPGPEPIPLGGDSATGISFNLTCEMLGAGGGETVALFSLIESSNSLRHITPRDAVASLRLRLDRDEKVQFLNVGGRTLTVESVFDGDLPERGLLYITGGQHEPRLWLASNSWVRLGRWGENGQEFALRAVALNTPAYRDLAQLELYAYPPD